MITLVIHFIIEGVATTVDGWHPLPMKTMEQCEIAKTKVIEYMDVIEVESFHVECKSIRPL